MVHLLQKDFLIQYTDKKHTAQAVQKAFTQIGLFTNLPDLLQNRGISQKTIHGREKICYNE